MPTRTQRIIGIILTVLVALGFASSAVGKLAGVHAVVENFAAIGIPSELTVPIGVIELVCVLLFVVPRTMFLGAILLTGYAGGGAFAHVRSGVGSLFLLRARPRRRVVLAVLAWVAFGLRRPAVLRSAFA